MLKPTSPAACGKYGKRATDVNKKTRDRYHPVSVGT